MRRRTASDLIVGDPLLYRPLRAATEMPLDEQIVERVGKLHAAGRLRKGAHLPRVRTFAKRLGVSHGTVSRAYKILASRGLIAASTRGVEMVVGTTDGAAPSMPWAPAVIRPLAPGDPLSASVRLGTREDHVTFDISECGPDLKPTSLIHEALTDVAPTALGYPPLRPLPECAEAVTRYVERRGVRLAGATLLVTSGTTHSLAVVARALGRPGGVVLTEHPTWHVALSVFGAAGLRVVGVPVDDAGLITDALSDVILRHAPAFLYVQPAFQNPTGLTLTADRRRQLLDCARRLHVPVVEDDFASELAFGAPPAPLHASDADVVIYLKSFAKLLAPGLRVGVIVAPTRYARPLEEAKHGLDPFVSALAQRVIATCLNTEAFDAHLKRLTKALEHRATTLARALKRARLPAGTRWTTPRGGLCAWIEFPPPIRTADLLGDLAARGVSLSPGHLFCLDQSGERSARLAFGATDKAAIVRGVERLVEVVERHMRSRRGLGPVMRGPAP